MGSYPRYWEEDVCSDGWGKGSEQCSDYFAFICTVLVCSCMFGAVILITFYSLDQLMLMHMKCTVQCEQIIIPV